MPSRIRILFFLAGGVLAHAVFVWHLSAAVPSDFWGQQTPAFRLETSDEGKLPVELLPAFRFQVFYGMILAGAKSGDWRSGMASLASAQASDPVSSGVRNAARIWLARAEMEDIDALLVEYYARHVRFPKTDADFQKLLPPGLSKDPWGQSWIYAPSAPRAFSPAMSGQRYQLSPSGMPGILSLKDAVKGRPALKLSSTVTPREIAGRHVLEFRSPQAVSVIDPGGLVDSFTLLFVGDHWALLSGEDRLFSIPF